MDESEFEGTLVLEKLAEKGVLDDFFAAVDSDDFKKAKSLMLETDLDLETISIVLKKMAKAGDEH